MNQPSTQTLQPFHLDARQLWELADTHREAYSTANPFPHVVLDDFLPEAVLDDVLAEFPAPQQVEWQAFDSPLERKLASKDDSVMGEATRQLFSELNSSRFIDFLEHLTGIEGLVPDPHLVGGGLHQIQRGGHLKVHADFNRHPRTDLERRLNVLIYLNRDWKEEYGGALELWSRDMSSCQHRVFPFFNRCVVFSTTDTSFHGHPEPLTCPDNRTRKSLALYYYSKERPLSERGGGHNTIFKARPGEALAPSETSGSEEAASGRAASTGGWRRVLVEMVRQLTPPIVLKAIRRALHSRWTRRS